MAEPLPPTGSGGWVERAGKAIPDPIIIFIGLWVLFFALSVLLGGHSFETPGPGGETIMQSVKPMHASENVRWIFNNALLQNWLAFGNGVLGVILIVIMAIGVAEHAGLLGALIKRAGTHIPERFLAIAVVFLGIMSSLATDAGYLILIPLAGLLYASLGKHPLVGMAAAFAGVSAGFSANLVPGTPIDVIVGSNAQAFAEAQGIAFATAGGRALTAATMNYWFAATSVFVLAIAGAFVTTRFVERRAARYPFTVPEDLDVGEFALTPADARGLKAAGFGLLAAIAIILALILGPLAAYQAEDGRTITPYLDNVILLISLVFVLCGAAFGFASGRFVRAMDVLEGMIAQMNTMGYVIVLSFFAYNALALFAYSGLGALMTQRGAALLIALGLQEAPVLLLIGFILLTSAINLMVGGLTSKWLLLGPMFIPMLYAVNPAMTPDVVAAAFRVGDSATNIVTPMMAYAGVILAFMRRYVPGFTLGEMFLMMVPYSVTFLIVWTVLLVGFFALGIPLGF